MNKKITFAFILAVFFAVGSLAMAEDESSATVSPTPVKTRVQERKTEVKETRDAIKTEIKTTRDAVKAEVKDTREQMKVQREEFNVQIKEKRQALQDQIKEKREALKERLQIVKDERKKAVVEKLDQRLDALNEKMTNHFSETLKKMDDLLVRIGERANQAEERGVDVSAVRSAITSASASIEASRAAIAVQAGKTYTITITSETGLRQDVGVVRQQLNQALRAVHATVISARESVRKAATTLAQLPKPTPSPSPSPEVEIEEEPE
ncbi:MAG: hypothetical protein Q8R34_01650 [bacterium]|nr:hypothetical protein [bacterium]